MGVTLNNFLEIANGAISECVNAEAHKVFENIMDVNTDAKKKRSITITVNFFPNAERVKIRTSSQVKSSLQPVSPIETEMIVGITKDGIVAQEITNQIPGQINFNGEETNNPKIFNYKRA